MKLTKIEKLQGEISVPGDKSISHRAVMFGSLAKGTTISAFPCGSGMPCTQLTAFERWESRLNRKEPM